MKPSAPVLRSVPTLAVLCAALTTAHASDGGWRTDWAAAKKAAVTEKKDLLIDFTGSDWCSWCQKLDKEVFADAAFREAAGKKFILVSLDFPQLKAQSDDEKTQNQKLQADFAVEGFPTVFLADSEGRPYARTGYQAGGPEAYLKHLGEISTGRAARDKALNAAAKAQGLEKAYHLKAALDALPDDLGSIPAYADLLTQIGELDKGDDLGFRKAATERAASQTLGKELEALSLGGKRDEIGGRVDSFLASHALEGNAKQTVLLMKLLSCGRDDIEAASKILDEVMAVDPTSEAAKQAQSLKNSFATARRKPATKPKTDQPK